MALRMSPARCVHKLVAVAGVVEGNDSSFESELKHRHLVAASDDLQAKIVAVSTAKEAYHAAVRSKDQAARDALALVERAQAGILSKFGVHSEEYALAIGKRSSSRRHKAHKSANSSQTSAPSDAAAPGTAREPATPPSPSAPAGANGASH